MLWRMEKYLLMRSKRPRGKHNTKVRQTLGSCISLVTDLEISAYTMAFLYCLLKANSGSSLGLEKKSSLAKQALPMWHAKLLEKTGTIGIPQSTHLHTKCLTYHQEMSSKHLWKSTRLQPFARSFLSWTWLWSVILSKELTAVVRRQHRKMQLPELSSMRSSGSRQQSTSVPVRRHPLKTRRCILQQRSLLYPRSYTPERLQKVYRL